MAPGRCPMNKLLVAVTVLVVSTTHADTIFVDANCS
jgi:hypothetical protein